GPVWGVHRARPNRGPAPERDRGYQRRVRADEGALADVGAMLGHAVVIAGDGPGPDVGALPDPGISQVAEMVRLCAGLDHGRLDLDEVPDLRLGADLGPGSQPGEWSDRCALPDVRPL